MSGKLIPKQLAGRRQHCLLPIPSFCFLPSAMNNTSHDCIFFSSLLLICKLRGKNGWVQKTAGLFKEDEWSNFCLQLTSKRWNELSVHTELPNSSQRRPTLDPDAKACSSPKKQMEGNLSEKYVLMGPAGKDAVRGDIHFQADPGSARQAEPTEPLQGIYETAARAGSMWAKKTNDSLCSLALICAHVETKNPSLIWS